GSIPVGGTSDPVSSEAGSSSSAGRAAPRPGTSGSDPARSPRLWYFSCTSSGDLGSSGETHLVGAYRDWGPDPPPDRPSASVAPMVRPPHPVPPAACSVNPVDAPPLRRQNRIVRQGRG